MLTQLGAEGFQCLMSTTSSGGAMRGSDVTVKLRWESCNLPYGILIKVLWIVLPDVDVKSPRSYSDESLYTFGVNLAHYGSKLLAILVLASSMG